MRKHQSLQIPQRRAMQVAEKRPPAPMMPRPQKHEEAEDHERHEGQHGEAMPGDAEMRPGHHRHNRWVTPPSEYADKRSTRWGDPAAIARGKQLFQTYCMVCHGADGKGTGPAAKGLEHPPADLTNHFHIRPGEGDAYLFWRVSEGGTVEPFKSMESAMPAFKNFLSEEQRWDVLAYVHALFHHGFRSEAKPNNHSQRK
jgi:mono/diheme cytochrome c family protein